MQSQSIIESKVISELNSEYKKLFTRITIALIGSIILALSAQVSFYLASPVPVTLQTFAITLMALTYGRKTAVYATVMYLTEGMLGLPVFAGFSPFVLSSMSMGYIVAFIPMAYIIGGFADSGYSNSKLGMVTTLFTSNMIVYTFGTLWAGLFFGFDQQILALTVIPFIIPDLIKTAAAITLAKVASK